MIRCLTISPALQLVGIKRIRYLTDAARIEESRQFNSLSDPSPFPQPPLIDRTRRRRTANERTRWPDPTRSTAQVMDNRENNAWRIPSKDLGKRGREANGMGSGVTRRHVSLSLPFLALL